MQKILLTGTCWYELTGLWHLLSAQGYVVHRVPLGYYCNPDGWSLVIVALSAEPVAGWGRYLSVIHNLKIKMSGKMLVLVPEKLKKLTLLQECGNICCGRGSLDKLINKICVILTREIKYKSQPDLTKGQYLALKDLSEKEMHSVLKLNKNKYKSYYHRARLVKNIGVRNVMIFLLAGLERELYNIKKLP